jgi:hypothetical protein
MTGIFSLSYRKSARPKMELVIGNGGMGNWKLFHLFLSLNPLNAVQN